VPLASIYSFTPLFWTGGQDELLKPYTEAYLQLVPTIHLGGTMPATTLTKGLFPQFGADLTFVETSAGSGSTCCPGRPRRPR
jgi:aminopeptidase N